MKRIILFAVTLLCFGACLSACIINNNDVTITGVVEQINENSIIITVKDNASFDKASVDAAQNTLIIKADGKKGSIFDIRLGDTVEITFSGQVRESYPVQISADKIAIMAMR